MKDLFIITFTVNEYLHDTDDVENRRSEHFNILGYFTESKAAMEYLMKYYESDVTHGDKNVEVIDEYMQTISHKQGNYYAKVQKKYKCPNPNITYTEEMEIKKIEQLSKESNPEDDIYSIYC